MFDQNFMTLPGISPQEYSYLQSATQGFNEQQLRTFLMVYAGKRKNPSDILLFTLLGFLGFAGIQRFVVGQIGMGILYILTCGLCFIGTIIDLINHKQITFEHNQRMVFESMQMVKMSNF
ncbi:TM2 domain-containing protein [Pedobacter sp. UBA4863]|uniref:TM2 domain-containing protein n=1 Tax=Pedobacter sp. UBA4863 TaxID=1947060 RepID=UPI0025EAD4FB|nr:TM2 domain-containing protein [Pedobacter sp. UBA4863]